MNKPAFAVLVAALTFLTGCNGDSYESISKELVTTTEELATELQGVKDVDSAKAALPKVEKLVDRMNGIHARMAKVQLPEGGQPNAELAQRMQQATTKMTMAAAQMPADAMQVLEPAMSKLKM